MGTLFFKFTYFNPGKQDKQLHWEENDKIVGVKHKYAWS